METKAHVCKLPIFRIPFGVIRACPTCGKKWIGDLVEDMGGEEVADWTAL